MTKVTYETIDKIRNIANDERGDPATREAAQAKLKEYATALVISNNGPTTWRDRVKARTETIIVSEDAKRKKILAEVEALKRAMKEAELAHEISMEKARDDHELYRLTAKDRLEAAQLYLDEQRIRRAAIRAAMAKVRESA